MPAIQNLEARMVFVVDTLVVTTDLLGTEHRLVRDDGDVWVKFPVDAERSAPPAVEPLGSWDVHDEVFGEPLPSVVGDGALGSISVRGTPPAGIAGVGCLRVRVPFTLSPPVYRGDEHADDDTDRLGAAFGDAIDRGREAAQVFIEQVRVVDGQYWLGPGHGHVAGAGQAFVVDVDVGQLIPYTVENGAQKIVLMTPRPLVPDRLAELLDAIARGRQPSLPGSLLSDAAHDAFHVPPDTRRAVLAAAIACEIAVRDALRRCASPEQLGVLDVLFANPRDFSIAALELFNAPMQAITGTRLKDETAAKGEVKLNTRVQELFTLRNQVAHRGAVPTRDEAVRAFRTATAALAWLDDRRPTPKRRLPGRR